MKNPIGNSFLTYYKNTTPLRPESAIQIFETEANNKNIILDSLKKLAILEGKDPNKIITNIEDSGFLIKTEVASIKISSSGVEFKSDTNSDSKIEKLSFEEFQKNLDEEINKSSMRQIYKNLAKLNRNPQLSDDKKTITMDNGNKISLEKDGKFKLEYKMNGHTEFAIFDKPSFSKNFQDMSSPIQKGSTLDFVASGLQGKPTNQPKTKGLPEPIKKQYGKSPEL
jgi:hypothetical protein